MSDNEKYMFPGKELDVEWDGRLCIHIAECGKSNGDVFVGGRKPWCNPDMASTEDVIDIVKRCPTGALVYQSKSANEGETPEPENTLSVAYNGPYFLRGDIEIDNAPDDMPGVEFRTALCRCGKSQNKPFCDNNHEKANFKDYGAIGDNGEGFDSPGGKITVKAAPDGPLLISGNLTMINGSGQVAWKGTQAALCRCGASNNKPFCDGMHVKVGFKSE